MMPVRPKVFLVDDEPELRRALERVLRAEGFVVESCGSATEFLAGLGPRLVGCVVLDLSMPDLDGLAVQQRLLDTGATLSVVFLTGRGDIPSSVRAMKAGAVDFLTKPVKAAELAAAVRFGMAQAEARHAEAELVSAMRERHALLTPREAEVMRHVIAGKLNKVIAADLGTTEQTIKVHRSRVMEKLAVGSVAELVNAARLMGIPAAD
jgi:FixJ family two-component response regulator